MEAQSRSNLPLTRSPAVYIIHVSAVAVAVVVVAVALHTFSMDEVCVVVRRL